MSILDDAIQMKSVSPLMAAASIEKILVPPDSSLDSELTSYLNEWNHLLDKEAKKNLTEDVNSLIRDYLRSGRPCRFRG